MINAKLTPEKIREFEMLAVLHYLDTSNQPVSVIDDTAARKCLEDPIKRLLAGQYIDIDAKNNYHLIEKGKTALNGIDDRRLDWLAVYDIFCGVDVKTWTFAFAKFHDFESMEGWKMYLNQLDMLDLRLAVVEYKNHVAGSEVMNLFDVVFIDWLQRGKFGIGQPDWEFRLMSGDIWKDMESLVQDSIGWKELGDDPNGTPEIMDFVLKRGTEVMIEIAEEEERRRKAASISDDDYYGFDEPATANGEFQQSVVTRVVSQPVTYYDYYSAAPYSVMDMWVDALIIDALLN